jgi:hypothetical protein
MRTALDARIARDALRRGRRLLGAGLGFPHYSNLASDTPAPARSGSILAFPENSLGS